MRRMVYLFKVSVNTETSERKSFFVLISSVYVTL